MSDSTARSIRLVKAAGTNRDAHLFGQDIYAALYAQKDDEDAAVSTSLTIRAAKNLIEQGYRKMPDDSAVDVIARALADEHSIKWDDPVPEWVRDQFRNTARLVLAALRS